MKTPTKIGTFPGENGFTERREYPISPNKYSDEQKKRYETGRLAKAFILEGISDEISKEISIKLESKKGYRKTVKISELELQIAEEKSVFEKEKKEFAKKFSEFSRKSFEEKKAFELKCGKLTKQISDFEKVIILEREKFDKENKIIERKNVGIFKEISGQRNNAEKGFEEERNIFEAEIKRLTEKLSENGSDTFRRKRRRRYEKEKLLWKVKLADDEKDDEKKNEKKSNKSFVHASNAKKNNVRKGKPDFSYSRDQLIRLSRKRGRIYVQEMSGKKSLYQIWEKESRNVGDGRDGRNDQELIVKERLLKEFKDFRIVEDLTEILFGDNLLKQSELYLKEVSQPLGRMLILLMNKLWEYC
ncbi:hypothetical protein L6452_02129 [Arctium lappa]|uniref:Uncharacterized protein n=1 Tax=Arctium lappa TaxID=4217 RepID=A0ACB9FJI8_ARCLA|nr:hypothetical protein L6452_02129 [Arctium lappa]